MTEIQMARVPVQCIADPKEWEIIKARCFRRRQTIGRFLVEAALEAIRREEKK